MFVNELVFNYMEKRDNFLSLSLSIFGIVDHVIVDSVVDVIKPKIRRHCGLWPSFNNTDF